jgi:Predicted xylanase/chitin deacetylase
MSNSAMTGGLAVGAAGLVAAGSVLAYAARARSSTLFGPSVWRGPRNLPRIALTFDDGPSEGTPELLRILDEYKVSATFFQCGVAVRRLPDVAREVVERGHEIGNHSHSHALLSLRSGRFIYEELAAANQAIAEATGMTPRLFRPPYGVRWFGLAQAQQRLGLLGVMWTVIGRDWKLGPAEITRRILRGAENGAILCLHDGREARPSADIRPTLEAVRHIVPALLERGYQFRTVSELIARPS